MTTSKLSSDANMPDETLFIRNSLAAVEKSEKIHRLKLVGFRVLLVIGAGWLGFELSKSIRFWAWNVPYL